MATEAPRKARRPYRVSGFHALVRATKNGGLSALDGRSSEAKALKLWKAQIGADLGGDLSAQKLTLLDVAAVDMALLAVADAWLKEHAGQLINRRKRTFVPLVAERLRVATHLTDTLRLLGLERRSKAVDPWKLLDGVAQERPQDAQRGTDGAAVGDGVQDAPGGDVGPEDPEGEPGGEL